MWSTGMEKKPWIWPAWRSMVSTRSTPAFSRQRGHELGGDRLARRGLLVLARVGVPRHDGRDAVRRGEARRVDHDQQLPEVVVRRRARAGLDDEDVGPADRLAVAAVDLAVRELLQVDVAELDPQLVADPLGELAVRAAREEHELALGAPLDVMAALSRGLGRLDRLEAGQRHKLSRSGLDQRSSP